MRRKCAGILFFPFLFAINRPLSFSTLAGGCRATSREVPPRSLVLLVSPVSAMAVKHGQQCLCWYSYK